MPADLLATIRAEVDARLAQLRPAIDEYEQLLSAADALEEEGRRAAPAREKAAPRRKAPVARKAPAVRQAPAAARATTSPKPAVRVATPAPAKPKRAASPKKRSEKAAPARSARNEAQQAIVAALEHGSHTVAELAVVTALSGPAIRESVRGLLKAGKVTKAKREGKAAYALAS